MEVKEMEIFNTAPNVPPRNAPRYIGEDLFFGVMLKLIIMPF